MLDTVFDIIVAGAGAAGCVLAGRLSEVPGLKVLLIEAGPDAPPGTEHADVRDSFPVSLGNPQFMWRGVTAVPGGLGSSTARPFAQGIGVGGSSNVQGMFAVRGIPEDYDEWRAAGVNGWGWDDVLPYFNKLERDLDFHGPLHGDSGPIPIRRIPSADWAPFSKAVGEALRRRGVRAFPDYNGDFGEGLSSIPMANLPHERVSTSMGYLTAAVRQRPNLTLLPDTRVERLAVESGEVRGVWVRTSDGVHRISARETLVACGALQSPAVLLRSGIGPGEPLRGLDIALVRELRGVGRNLQNHPKVQDIAVHLPRASRQSRAQRTLGQNCLRYSSGVQGCGAKDMFVVSLNKTSWHALGHDIGAIAAVIHKPYSKGFVELAGADPAAGPKVQFNVLSDARDQERLVGGLRLILSVLNEPEVRAARHEAFLPQGKVAASLAQRKPANARRAWAIASLFEIGPLRRRLLQNLLLDVDRILGNEGTLREIVRERVELSRHPCGTCKMGRADDPDAVVDASGRVHGVPGVRVTDASIFPTLMRGNTHIPVIMAAEKLADQIKQEWEAS